MKFKVKRLPPNSGSKAAFRDPTVELDVSGKKLTDAGFAKVAYALVESLGYDSDQGKVARLEELCLRDNHLHAKSLHALTPVIKLSSYDLRDLDLSDNNITINTDEDVATWENFLLSFSRCCVLRKIDFRGSALGSRAFEVLLRVYAKEMTVSTRLLDNTDVDHDQETASSNLAALERRAQCLSIRAPSGEFAAHVKSGFRKLFTLFIDFSICHVIGLSGTPFQSRSPRRTLRCPGNRIHR